MNSPNFSFKGQVQDLEVRMEILFVPIFGELDRDLQVGMETVLGSSLQIVDGNLETSKHVNVALFPLPFRYTLKDNATRICIYDNGGVMFY